MKKLVGLFVAACLLSSATFAGGIATVDTVRAIQGTDVAKKMSDEVSGDLKGKMEKAQTLQLEIQELKNKGERDAMTMSQAEQLELKQNFERKMMEFNSLRESVKSEMAQMDQKFSGKMENLLFDAVKKIAIEKGYDAVLPKQAVLYVPEGVDITEQVTAQINVMTAEK